MEQVVRAVAKKVKKDREKMHSGNARGWEGPWQLRVRAKRLFLTG